MRKFESSQKDESRAQLADSSKAYIENVELFIVTVLLHYHLHVLVFSNCVNFFILCLLVLICFYLFLKFPLCCCIFVFAAPCVFVLCCALIISINFHCIEIDGSGCRIRFTTVLLFDDGCIIICQQPRQSIGK